MLTTLFAAASALVHDGPKPAKALASETGIGYGYLMKAVDDHQPEVQLQARWIAPLTKASGNDVLIKQIAHDCGGVFVRLVPNDSHDAHTAKTLKEMGEYLTKLAESASNGYSTSEVAAIESEGEDVIASIVAQIAKLKAEAK